MLQTSAGRHMRAWRMFARESLAITDSLNDFTLLGGPILLRPKRLHSLQMRSRAIVQS